MGQETWTMDIRLLEICLMSPNLRFLVPTAVYLWDGEKVNGCSLHVWFLPWSMEVVVWWCFAGEVVSDLFRIQGTLNQHGYHSILQRYTIPSGLSLVSFVFPTGQWPKTPPGCIRVIWPRSRLMSAASDDLASTITQPQPNWDGLGWVGPQECKNVLGYYMIPYVLFHSFDVFTIIVQCRK